LLLAAGSPLSARHKDHPFLRGFQGPGNDERYRTPEKQCPGACDILSRTGSAAPSIATFFTAAVTQ
jgi:hypothetical protein